MSITNISQRYHDELTSSLIALIPEVNDIWGDIVHLIIDVYIYWVPVTHLQFNGELSTPVCRANYTGYLVPLRSLDTISLDHIMTFPGEDRLAVLAEEKSLVGAIRHDPADSLGSFSYQTGTVKDVYYNETHFAEFTAMYTTYGVDDEHTLISASARFEGWMPESQSLKIKKPHDPSFKQLYYPGHFFLDITGHDRATARNEFFISSDFEVKNQCPSAEELEKLFKKYDGWLMLNGAWCSDREYPRLVARMYAQHRAYAAFRKAILLKEKADAPVKT